MVKTQPTPGTSRTLRSTPAFASTLRRDMERPSPKPVLSSLFCVNGTNILSASPAADHRNDPSRRSGCGRIAGIWRTGIGTQRFPVPHRAAVASPVLSNIYLDRFDRFIEQWLLPEYNLGDRRLPEPGVSSRGDRDHPGPSARGPGGGAQADPASAVSSPARTRPTRATAGCGTSGTPTIGYWGSPVPNTRPRTIKSRIAGVPA